MKIGFLILIVLSSIICSGQSNDSNSTDEMEFNEINNYIPKSLINDTATVLFTWEDGLELSSMSGIYLTYIFQEYFRLDSSEIIILENRINILVDALCEENRYIIIKQVGGYGGCPDEMLLHTKKYGLDVIIMNYCYSCTNFTLYDARFIKLFNDRMYLQMGVIPPSYKTHEFYGEYKGVEKHKSGMKLILTEDGEFIFWITEGNTSKFTKGYWFNNNDILILNSYSSNRTDSITKDQPNIEWIAFKDKKFRLKRKKLIDLIDSKKKLKKAKM